MLQTSSLFPASIKGIYFQFCRILGIAIAAAVIGSGPKCLAQSGDSSPTPRTKLQTFDNQSGAVVLKEFTEIGVVKGAFDATASFVAIRFTNARTKATERGLSIRCGKSSAFIDYDEIDALVAGIDFVRGIKKDVTNMENFEAIYRTKGGLSLTVFSQRDELMASLKVDFGTGFFSLEQVDSIRGMILKGKECLDKAAK